MRHVSRTGLRSINHHTTQDGSFVQCSKLLLTQSGTAMIIFVRSMQLQMLACRLRPRKRSRSIKGAGKCHTEVGDEAFTTSRATTTSARYWHLHGGSAATLMADDSLPRRPSAPKVGQRASRQTAAELIFWLGQFREAYLKPAVRQPEEDQLVLPVVLLSQLRNDLCLGLSAPRHRAAAAAAAAASPPGRRLQLAGMLLTGC